MASNSAPKFVAEQVKATVCPKKKFPYGNSSYGHYYDPTCSGAFGCKDVCGEQCTKKCEEECVSCQRGKLPDNFLSCPGIESASSFEVPYVELVYVLKYIYFTRFKLPALYI